MQCALRQTGDYATGTQDDTLHRLIIGQHRDDGFASASSSTHVSSLVYFAVMGWRRGRDQAGANSVIAAPHKAPGFTRLGCSRSIAS